ncbi:MAG: biosynthetic peptidoglycan transglycosylase [Mucilaginibacter sp.]|uniref:biosynthetic peptidoglycan transglycosylase n=1 Tax=Mucilaginibacter sp. TaxID=1882438 RepID=UPI00326742A9
MFYKSKRGRIVGQLIFIMLLSIFRGLKWINKIYHRKIEQLARANNIKLSIKEFKFNQYNQLEIQELEIEKGSFLVRLSKISIQFSLSSFLKKTFRQSLEVAIGTIHLTKKQTSNNPNFKQFDTSEIASELYNWEKLYYEIFEKGSNYLFQINPDISIELLSINIHNSYIQLKELSYVNDSIRSSIDTASAVYKMEGTVCRSPRSIVFTAVKSELAIKHDSVSHFDFFDFKYTQSTDKDFRTAFINIAVKVEKLTLKNTHINHDLSLIDNLELDMQIELNDHNFSITEQSGGSINQLPFAFEFMHDAEENDVIRTIFYIEIDGDLLLKSFPQFCNEDIRTLGVQGKIILKFSLMFLITDPYNHLFEILILENNISISENGNFDLSYLHGYHKDKTNNSLDNFSTLNGIKNIKLSDVNPMLLSIFVLTEDPNFYSHKGVDAFFVGRAIVDNIAKRKFARGASTITMQMVRNLFLFHNKTIFRKLEETLISLLIENHFKIPKTRILEIYLNIIEFGPGVYGINAASEFYFSKKPIDLTLLESIVLSYIIPRPKHFYDALQLMTPQLMTNLPTHVRRISRGMLKMNLITQSEYANLGTEIQFGNQFGEISLN